MPCYSPTDEDMAFERGVQAGLRKVAHHHPDDKKMMETLLDEVKKREAGLCAIINELEKRGLTHEILSEATTNGQIDLLTFWAEHYEEDKARLAKELKQFSKHEIAVIKKLLKEK